MNEKTFPLRSLQQHNTEWLYYKIIASTTGYKAYEIYEVFAARILKVVDDEGDLAYIKPSSLNTAEHNEYMERLRCEAAEMGYILPDPEIQAPKLVTKKIKR